MNNILTCSVCKFDCTHFVSTIEIHDNDDYKTTKFIINKSHTITAQLKTSYRSQGNIHLLFRCEEGHFFVKSFDGHKGNMNLDSNSIMDELTVHLNKAYKTDKGLNFDLNYRLLGEIERFLIAAEKANR